MIPFDTEEEAIALANDSQYGLAAAVHSQNVDQIGRVTNALEAGTGEFPGQTHEITTDTAWVFAVWIKCAGPSDPALHACAESTFLLAVSTASHKTTYPSEVSALF